MGQLLKMPGYLSLTRDRRRAFTQLMASEHPYAVQTRRAVERKFPVCRFCCERTAIAAESLLLSRLRMRAQMSRYDQSAAFENDHRTPWQFVAYLLSQPQLLSLFEDHILRTFALCKTTPVLAVNSDANSRDLKP